MLFLNNAFDSDFFDPKELQFFGFCEVSASETWNLELFF